MFAKIKKTAKDFINVSMKYENITNIYKYIRKIYLDVNT